MASVVPRGLIGRIYVGDHQTLLHTEYMSSASWFQRRRFFLVFPVISLWELMTHLGVASLGLRGLIGSMYVGDH